MLRNNELRLHEELENGYKEMHEILSISMNLIYKQNQQRGLLFSV